MIRDEEHRKSFELLNNAFGDNGGNNVNGDKPGKHQRRSASAEPDEVNHPSHYNAGSIEVIDYIEDQEFPFHLGNAVKYISRSGLKDPTRTIQDLQKAVWYINRYIGLLQKQDQKNE